MPYVIDTNGRTKTLLDLASVGGTALALGQTTMSASLPVVIASDQSAVPVSGTFWQATQPISAAALPLPSGAATVAKQPALGTAGTASTDVITVQGITSGTALNVTDAVTSAAAHAEDTASSDGHYGMAALAVRKATPANTSDTDGDYEFLQMSAGRLWCSSTITGTVAVTDNAGSLTVDAPVGTPVFVRLSDGSSAITTLAVSLASVPSHAVTNAGTFVVQVDGAALTSLQLIDDIVYTDDTSTHATGTSKGALIMAAATPTDGSVNANDIGAVAMTVDRKLHVAVMDALPAGTAAIGKLAANSGVDIGDVDVLTCGTITPGTAATNLGKAEDAGHTTGDTGIAIWGVRNDTPTSLSGTNLDYTPLATDDFGRLNTVSKTATAVLSSVSCSASSYTVLALNTARLGAMIVNESTALCYLKFGTTASTTSYTVLLRPGAYYELPQPCYTGRIDAIQSSANGSLRITEIT